MQLWTFFKRLGTGLLIVTWLVACSSPRVSDYASQTPKLDLKRYFNGDLMGYGMFTARSGEVVKRFTVRMSASWSEIQGVPTGVLKEDFTYSDGTEQQRIWRLREVAPGRFVGEADDVVGLAQGQARGPALNWRYTLALPVDGTTYHMQFDDWMYLIDDKVMLNRARMSKFGIDFGEVTLSFVRP